MPCNPAMKAPFTAPRCHRGRKTIRMTEPNKLTHPGVPDHQPAAGGSAARARAAATPQYLAGLNAEQREAVETLDGPVLVLAGTGTGKTRVLTCRIAHILSIGRARPGEILSVTFTNKAAREMKLRLGQMLGQAVEGMPWLGTFHSIGGRILRTHAEMVQLKSNFTVLDVDEQLRLLAQSPSNSSAHLARRLRGEVGLRSNPGKGDSPPASLLEGPPHPSPLPASGEREKAPPKNICCVGDDDQSIYGWRGAEVDNILRFEHDFPGATVIRLERNYRSTGHILAAASHLIAHNEGRLGKTLRTEDELGEKVAVTGAWDSEEEARAIGEEIEQLQRDGHTLNEIAILVRASFQMREFEDRFVTLGLPYRVIGGPRFYERAEIRDALAYLRLVNQPADDLAFERIINVPKRGLGDATVKLLHDHARKRRISMMEATRALIETDELKPKPRGALRDLLAGLDRWRAQEDTLPHTE